MGRRDNQRRKPTARLDFSELETNDILMEDLQHYVGSPKVYIPQIWDVCVRVLREENRIVLTNRDNGEVLDHVYTDFYTGFSDTKFERIVEEIGISVRRDGYRENVAQFLYDVFEIIYPQVASTVDRLLRENKNGELLNYKVKVRRVHYEYFNNGFGETERPIAVDVEILTENMLTTKLLSGDGYGL